MEEFEMDGSDIEFVAYSRKLLRALKHVREEIDKGNMASALKELDELIQDTEKDIEA